MALTLALLIALTAANAMGADGPRARLQSAATVAGRTVTLGDVAKVDGADEGSLAMLRQIELATAPQPGSVVHLTQREVERLVHAAGYPNLELSGASATTVEATGEALDVARLGRLARDYLRSALERDGRALNVAEDDTAPAILVPRGALTLTPRKQSFDRPHTHMTVWVDVAVDDRFYRAVQVPLHVVANEMVLIARADLAKGATPDCASLIQQERDVARLDAAPLPAHCSDLGRLRRNVATGDVLLANVLEPIPAVTEGDYVSLSVQNGAVALETRAVALLDGQIGQHIPVRASGSEDTVLAQVIGRDAVKVTGR